MLAEEVKQFLHGEVLSDTNTLKHYSRDASLFEITPEAVVFPKNADDIKHLVRFAQQRRKGKKISLTARAAGTDMSGGPLNNSLILDVTKHLNYIGPIRNNAITVEPGAFYRDFEKATLKKGLLLPPYPASRELCALGGMIANNAGGEKSLRYGKVIDYVTKLNVILSDGNEYTFKPLTTTQLNKKLKQRDFEGQIYRKTHHLLNKHYTLVQQARPDVSKNSSGYNLWDVWDKKTFDLTKLFVGSQGTLGIITKANIKLVKTKPHAGMVVIFCNDMESVTNIISTVLPMQPSSFESFDDYSLKLALKFFPGFLSLMGAANIFTLAVKFLPEFLLVLRGGLPKLTLLIEFEEDTAAAARRKVDTLRRILTSFPVRTKGMYTRQASQKYWLIRRESFNILRNKLRNKQSAPFIDDFIINPLDMNTFMPQLTRILQKYNLTYTIIGHIGNGNFHIIPLMVLGDEHERQIIPQISEEVYKLILRYNGSITAEHNDGLIRSPYLQKMYGKRVYALFKDIKNIFDPHNIFNPGKKVFCNLHYSLEHIKRS